MGENTTIQDIARELSVHKSTVSLALSGKGNVSAATRARVVAYARERGYEPDPLAQRLARGVHDSLVCLFSGALDVGLTTEKVLRIQQSLSARGQDVPIYTCLANADGEDSTQLAQIRQICRQRPRAIVYAAHRADSAVYEALDDYQRQGGIVVSYDSPVPIACDQVIFDREDNGYQAARHLLAMGQPQDRYRLHDTDRSPPPAQRMIPKRPRMRGFRRALAEFGLSPRPDWIFHNDLYERGGAEMAREFLAPSRASDRCLHRQRLRRAGIHGRNDARWFTHSWRYQRGQP